MPAIRKNVRGARGPGSAADRPWVRVSLRSLQIDNTLDVYGKLNDECRVKGAAIKTARAGAEESAPNAAWSQALPEK
jgi:hypothetical protein